MVRIFKRIGNIVIPVMLLLLFLLSAGCKENNSTAPFQGFEIIRENGQIMIKDQTGKTWNITEAVETYHFVPEDFQFGLGPAAIEPINNPQFLSEQDPGYPSAANDFLVIGYNQVEINRAYSLNILVHHEVVNDVYADEAVAVGYCPLVNLTAVYRRQLFGSTITLSASGWTYNDTFVIYDFETESLWYPLPDTSGLTCISGFYTGQVLPELLSVQTRWADWVNNNPGTLFLKSPTSGN